MIDNPFDDVDRLFARLDRAPVPEDLTAKILANTVERTNARRAVLAWPWIVAGLAALSVLALAGYQLGVSFAASDGQELVSAILGDVGLIGTAPGDVLAALSEVLPGKLLAVAALSAVLVILSVGNIVSRPRASPQARRYA